MTHFIKVWRRWSIVGRWFTAQSTTTSILIDFRVEIAVNFN